MVELVTWVVSGNFVSVLSPWIAVAYDAPVAAATAVLFIYPIGQGSVSDGWYASRNLRYFPLLDCIPG